MAISDIIADDVTGHGVDLLRFEGGERRKARNALKLLEIDLVEKLNEIDPTSPQRQTYRVRRMERLLEETRESIRNSYRNLRDTNFRTLVSLAELDSEALVNTVNRALTVELMSATFTENTLRALVSNVLITGTPLAEWWAGQNRNTRMRFESEMRLGVLSGESLGQLRQRIRGRHTGRYTTVTLKNGQKRRHGVFAGGIMATVTRNADSLIRTSTQAVSNRVREETLSQNEDIIKGRQVLATLDGRTSLICIARSGQGWNNDGSPIADTGATTNFPGPPPWHVRCRSTLIPILRSWAELAGKNSKLSNRKLRRLQGAGTRTQASLDGQVSSALNYERWLQTKPVAFQREVLGPRRYELWKAGEISSLSQLIDQSGRPLTLNQLRGRVERRRIQDI